MQKVRNMNDHSIKILKDALGLDDEHIKYLISGIEALKIKELKSACEFCDNGNRVVIITSADDREYMLYINSGGSIDGAKNLKTGKWEMRIIR